MTIPFFALPLSLCETSSFLGGRRERSKSSCLLFYPSLMTHEMVILCKACVGSRKLQGEEQLLRQLRNLKPRACGSGLNITQLSLLLSTLFLCIFTSILDCQLQASGGQKTCHPPYTASTALNIYRAITLMEVIVRYLTYTVLLNFY